MLRLLYGRNGREYAALVSEHLVGPTSWPVRRSGDQSCKSASHKLAEHRVGSGVRRIPAIPELGKTFF